MNHGFWMPFTLSDDGTFYTVVTAFPTRQTKKYPQAGGSKLLWRRGPTPPSGVPGASPRLPPTATTGPGQPATGGTGQSDENTKPDDDERYSLFGTEGTANRRSTRRQRERR
jgi:hypothetical protein